MAHSDSPRTNWLHDERWLLAGLLAFTLLARGGVLWAMRGNLEQDPDAYREIAENLLRHGQFALGQGDPAADGSPIRPTAYRPPLYPVVLSNLPAAGGKQISLVKVAALHLLLGVATVWLTWLTARRLLQSEGPEGRQEVAPTVRSGLSEKNEPSVRSGGPTLNVAASGAGPPGLAVLITGLIVACDPILLNQQTLVMTETLAAFLAVLSLWCLTRFDDARSWFNAALSGGAIGLAVLCRPTFLPWLGLVGLAMLLVRGRNAEFRMQNAERSLDKLSAVRWASWWSQLAFRVTKAMALVVAAAIVMSPWAIRNYHILGKPIVTTTHGGYTLLLGNNEFFYNWLDSPTVVPWSAANLDATWRERWNRFYPPVREPAELKVDRFNYQWAVSVIQDRPVDFGRACVFRIQQLWSPLPHKLTTDESTGRRLLRYATCVWYCSVYVLAAIGVWRLRWKLLQPPWIWGVLLCLAFTAAHTFYWTNLRMRAPLMPFIAIVAAAATASSKFQVPSSKLSETQPETGN